MIEWLILPGAVTPELGRRLGAVWRGSAAAASPYLGNKARACTIVAPDSIQVTRQPRWPDVLSDWSDIYEEKLFPGPTLPVAGELWSESGGEALALYADLGHPGGARGGIAWYQKGGLVELEQVGKAAVGWQKGQPLGRPKVSDARSQLASLGRAMADSERDAALYERVESSRSASTEAVLHRALTRIFAVDPPPLNELAELVRKSSPVRVKF